MFNPMIDDVCDCNPSGCYGKSRTCTVCRRVPGCLYEHEPMPQKQCVQCCKTKDDLNKIAEEGCMCKEFYDCMRKTPPIPNKPCQMPCKSKKKNLCKKRVKCLSKKNSNRDKVNELLKNYDNDDYAIEDYSDFRDSDGFELFPIPPKEERLRRRLNALFDQAWLCGFLDVQLDNTLKNNKKLKEKYYKKCLGISVSRIESCLPLKKTILKKSKCCTSSKC